MNKRILLPLFLIFLDIISFSFLLPAIPFIVEGFGYGASYVGITVGLTALGMILGGFLFGRLSDIFGKKKILLITLLINFIGYILFIFSGNLFVFIFARFLNGLGGGGVSIMQAYIGDISSEKERIVHMGYIGAAYGIGFILGPALGFFLANQDLQSIGYYSASLLLLSFFITLFFLKVEHNENIKHLPESSKVLIKRHFYFFLISFGITASLIGIQSIFPLYLKDFFGFEIEMVYLIFSFMGITAAIYQVTIFKLLQKHMKETNIILSGMILFIIGFIGMIINTNVFLLFCIVALLIIGLSNINNALFAILIGHSNKKNMGSVFGLNTSFGSFGDMFGGFVAGMLYSITQLLPFMFFCILSIGIFSVFYIKEIRTNKLSS